MKDKPYLTVKKQTNCEIAAIKGSRFLGFVVPVTDDAAAMEYLQQIKNTYPDARHWCWAYQLREQQRTRFSDDGEPNGSAGKPILAPIVGKALFDTMVIVVRYFGGVKLGVGGLVRAYSAATNAVLEQAEIIQVVPKVTLTFSYQYDDTGQVAAALSALKLTEQNTIYSDCVHSELYITKAQVEMVSEQLINYTAGKVRIQLFDD